MNSITSKRLGIIQKQRLIFGYIREMERKTLLSYDFPSGIINIIILYYPIKNFEFKRLDYVQISDDGLSLRSTAFLTVRFGEFLHKNERMIYKVIFEIKEANHYNVGVAFMTSEFDEKTEEPRSYNTGNNHSCVVTGNGFFVDSPEDFVSEYQDSQIIAALNNLWRKGDKLHVEIDMIEQKGRMWNDKDKERKSLFEIDIPESVAIFIDGAGEVDITAIHQQFRYKK